MNFFSTATFALLFSFFISCNHCQKTTSRQKNGLSTGKTADSSAKANDLPGAKPEIQPDSSHAKTGNNAQVKEGEHTHDPGTYPLLISFYSIGEGIDYKTLEKLEEFINKQSQKVTFEKISWGREGETDYCFMLKGLTLDEKKTFIASAKEIVKKSQLVHIKENTNCINKSN